MKSQAELYLYKVVWSEEDGEYLGLVAEFPSLSWLAPTPTQALQGMIDLVAEVLADLALQGQTPPEPLSTRHYSGRFMVRVSGDTHRRLVRKAAEQNVSLNALVSETLATVS